jgi:hypothetical protein
LRRVLNIVGVEKMMAAVAARQAAKIFARPAGFMKTQLDRV